MYNRTFSDEITASFRRFGQLVVDWPHKAESKSYFPPKGYAFLLFQARPNSFESMNHSKKLTLLDNLVKLIRINLIRTKDQYNN